VGRLFIQNETKSGLFFNFEQQKETIMKAVSDDFTLKVDGVQGVCAAGEVWAEERLLNKQIPVLSCEGPCVRGDIARRAANIVGKQAPFGRACYAETALVPHSSMARWVKEADKVVMVDGCFLQCMGRVLNNLVDEDKIVQINAYNHYKKYADIFYMEDVPETERIAAAEQVAEKILPTLRERVASISDTAGGEEHVPDAHEKETEDAVSTGCGG
jgi:uncharacterized metal-binding protein